MIFNQYVNHNLHSRFTSMKPEIRGWKDVADLDFIEPVETLNAFFLK